LHEVDHVADRINRLDRAIEEAAEAAPPRMRAVIEALQALRSIALTSAVTIVTKVGQLSRFTRARQLMGYGGASIAELFRIAYGTVVEQLSGEHVDQHSEESSKLTAGAVQEIRRRYRRRTRRFGSKIDRQANADQSAFSRHRQCRVDTGRNALAQC
jgi:hypothetical protein